jgi:integrase
MTTSVIPFGTQIASDIRDPSANCADAARGLKTLENLLDILGEKPPPAFPMLKTTSALLAAYLDQPISQITIDSVNESRDGFRRFLEGRKHKENSIRSYVNYARILLRIAAELGWKPNHAVPEEWRTVLALARERKCETLANYIATVKKRPRDVSIEDVDHWVQMRAQQGHSYNELRRRRSRFWRLLRDCGCTEQTPLCLLREKNYGVPLAQFPLALKREVSELLRWKRAEFSPNRPKDGQHREVTSGNLKGLISALFGYAVNIRSESEITSLPLLVQSQIISGYVQWAINERKVKGYCLRNSLGLLSAAMHQHPSYASVDLRWFKPLLDSLPMERKSESKRRKAEKYLEYAVVESIPAQIRAERPAAVKRGIEHVALLGMEELIMRWLITLPWRQLNLRECRISGPTPNLFKDKISPFSEIDEPDWVKQMELKNPEAQFWQFRFSVDETKTGIDVHSLLPRQLIEPLEEYLKEFRPHLLGNSDPGTLLINQAGNAMEANQIRRVVESLTLRFGGTRVTPHLFRDIVAFAWLKAHPKDFLSLSKMLWHSSPDLAIKTYGSRFNESSGVCAMESWLEEREAKSK